MYRCRGDLTSFNERYYKGGVGNSQDKRHALRKELRENRVEAELWWKRYEDEMECKGAKVDEALESCYADAIRTTEQATTLLEREMRIHLIAVLDELEDRPAPNAPPDKGRDGVTTIIVTAKGLLKWAEENKVREVTDFDNVCELHICAA